MYGGISLIGWFHTIIGTAGILTGIYLLIRHNFIDIPNVLIFKDL